MFSYSRLHAVSLSPEVFRGPVGGGVGEGGGVVVEGDDGDEGEGHQHEEEG